MLVPIYSCTVQMFGGITQMLPSSLEPFLGREDEPYLSWYSRLCRCGSADQYSCRVWLPRNGSRLVTWSRQLCWKSSHEPSFFLQSASTLLSIPNRTLIVAMMKFQSGSVKFLKNLHAEQIAKLQVKNQTECELLEDLRYFFRCNTLNTNTYKIVSIRERKNDSPRIFLSRFRSFVIKKSALEKSYCEVRKLTDKYLSQMWRGRV